MDKLLWIAMSGAKENFNSLGIRSNNLANANTTGFKADYEQARAMSVFNNAYPTRAFSMAERPGYNMEGGSVITTDNPLDCMIQGPGFFAVRDLAGNEAYTRNGAFKIDEEGVLKTVNGLTVLDADGTEIILPPMLEAVQVSPDGVISGRPQGAAANVVEVYQRIKMTKVDSYAALEKGHDGLFRLSDGTELAADDNVRLKNGMVESSNVNPVEELTSLIRLQRQFDTQMKMIKTADEMDQSQTRLMSYE